MERSDNVGQSVLDVVLRFFEEEQWSHQKIEGKPIVRAGYRGEHGTWVCYVRYEADDDCLFFHSLMGLNIPPRVRIPVDAYLSQVNEMISTGGFEIDMWSGDVSLKSCTHLPEGGATVKWIRALAYGNVNAMDHFFPGVIAIVYGGQTPEVALAKVEMTPISGPAGTGDVP